MALMALAFHNPVALSSFFFALPWRGPWLGREHALRCENLSLARVPRQLDVRGGAVVEPRGQWGVQAGRGRGPDGAESPRRGPLLVCCVTSPQVGRGSLPFFRSSFSVRCCWRSACEITSRLYSRCSDPYAFHRPFVSSISGTSQHIAM
jgi:hypothetical protein